MWHYIVVYRHLGAPLFTQRRPRKPETAPYTLRRAPSTRRRPREAAPICCRPCLLPTHRRLPRAAKHPLQMTAPTRGARIYRCPCLVPNQRRLPPPPKCGEAPCPLGGAHTNWRPLPPHLLSAFLSASLKSGEAPRLAGGAHARLRRSATTPA